jgi:hypothetical protein
MKSKFLLPNRYKLIGWIITIPSLVLGIMHRFFDFIFDFLTVNLNKSTEGLFDEKVLNFTDELAMTGLIVGLLFIAFSREREEDEYISRIRLESLQWAVLVNYVLLLAAIWFIHGLKFLDVMVYNMLTILILFNVRYHIILYRNRLSVNN